MALTAEEREVTISFSDADNLATVYTASPKWIRKFDRLVSENPTEYAELTNRRQYAGTDVISKTYTMPIHLISIRTKSREYTDEQRAIMAERLKAVRN